MQKSIFEQMGGTYTHVGEYLIPDLVISDTEQSPLRKYGRMRKRYLKEHRPVLYTNLLVTGNLDQHLAEIDEACDKRMELLMKQMSTQEGVADELKASDQKEGVRRMNSNRNRAEEIVLQKLIYSD